MLTENVAGVLEHAGPLSISGLLQRSRERIVRAVVAVGFAITEDAVRAGLPCPAQGGGEIVRTRLWTKFAALAHQAGDGADALA